MDDVVCKMINGIGIWLNVKLLMKVLMGDLKPAIEQHEVLYQITKRHHFLPEAVTSDFQVR